MGLEVEMLEKPLNVNSPLGTRVSVDQICRDYELEISGILLSVDLRVIDMSEFDVILDSSLTMIVGELLPTHRTGFVLCFRRINTMLYPGLCTTLGCMDS